jgi:hypothetical protein
MAMLKIAEQICRDLDDGDITSGSLLSLLYGDRGAEIVRTAIKPKILGILTS